MFESSYTLEDILTEVRFGGEIWLSDQWTHKAYCKEN